LSLASMASSSGSGRYDADSSPEPISRVASRQSSGGGGGCCHDCQCEIQVTSATTAAAATTTSTTSNPCMVVNQILR
jgi:hypothetical protein